MWTEDERTKLRAAIASGVLTVRYDGPPARSVTYQSLSAMRALLAEMNRAIDGPNGGQSYRLASHSKGF